LIEKALRSKGLAPNQHSGLYMPDTTAPPATNSTTEPPDTTTQEQQQQEPGKAKGDEKEAKRPRTRSSMLVVKEVKPRVVSPDVEEEEELDFECDINTPSAISRPLMIQPKADEEPAPSPEPSSPPPPPPGSPPPAQRDDNNDKVTTCCRTVRPSDATSASACVPHLTLQPRVQPASNTHNIYAHNIRLLCIATTATTAAIATT
jgi:hypothetical protein